MTEIALDEATHTYRVAGRVLPSVTSVGDWMDEYAGVPPAVLAAAADRGRAVHLACELDDLGELDGMPDEIAPYVQAWRRLREETGAVMLATEHRVADLAFGYAGTLDWIGTFSRLKGIRATDLCIVDRKATAAIMPSVGPQTAGYLAAWNAMHKADRNLQARRRFVAHLRADSTYRLIEQTSPLDLTRFRSGLNLYQWRAEVRAGGIPQ